MLFVYKWWLAFLSTFFVLIYFFGGRGGGGCQNKKFSLRNGGRGCPKTNKSEQGEGRVKIAKFERTNFLNAPLIKRTLKHLKFKVVSTFYCSIRVVYVNDDWLIKSFNIILFLLFLQLLIIFRAYKTFRNL